MQQLPLKIIATGMALPKHQVPSTQLDDQLGLARGTVEERSGIKSRYYFDDSDTLSKISADAIKDAAVNGGIQVNSIDLVIAASAVPEQALPCSAAKILAHLDVHSGTAGFDINVSCLSFLNALHVATNLLANHAYERIAIVSTEFASRGINWVDFESSAIFGDGSAAVIVEHGTGESACLSYLSQIFPAGNRYCEIRAGGSLKPIKAGINPEDYYFKMDGKNIFKLASETVAPFLSQLFASLNFSIDDLNVIVPHQASHLSLKHMIKRLKFKRDKVVNIYESYGNQVSASMPMALHHAAKNGLLYPGAKVLLIGTGAGLCWGGMVLSL